MAFLYGPDEEHYGGAGAKRGPALSRLPNLDGGPARRLRPWHLVSPPPGITGNYILRDTRSRGRPGGTVPSQPEAVLCQGVSRDRDGVAATSRHQAAWGASNRSVVMLHVRIRGSGRRGDRGGGDDGGGRARRSCGGREEGAEPSDQEMIQHSRRTVPAQLGDGDGVGGLDRCADDLGADRVPAVVNGSGDLAVADQELERGGLLVEGFRDARCVRTLTGIRP